MTLYRLVELLFDVYYILLIARIIMSFFPMNLNSNPFLMNVIGFLYRATEPVLAPFRKLIPSIGVGGGASLDLSPILALIVLRFVRSFVLGLIATA